MIRPIIATDNPYTGARQLEKCGWTITFQTPPDSGDPLTGVSLYDNQVLLGILGEKYVKKEALPHLGTGIEIHILVPANQIQKIYENHALLSPTALKEQPWGEIGFKFVFQGYRFMILAEGD